MAVNGNRQAKKRLLLLGSNFVISKSELSEAGARQLRDFIVKHGPITHVELVRMQRLDDESVQVEGVALFNRQMATELKRAPIQGR